MCISFSWPPNYLFQYPLLSDSSLFTLSYCVTPTASSLFSWISVLQNSKEEALNNAFKGDQHVGENNIVQELTKAILGEVKHMTGNDVCCDCGAPGERLVIGRLTFTRGDSGRQNLSEQEEKSNLVINCQLK